MLKLLPIHQGENRHMNEHHRQSIFTKYAFNLSAHSQKIISQPLKDHPQIPYVIDTLSRSERHHLCVLGTHSEKMNLAFAENLAQHLRLDHIHHRMREHYFVYFDVMRFAISFEQKEHIEKDFLALWEEAKYSNKMIIFAINQIEPLLTQDDNSSIAVLGKLIKSVLTQEQWRFIVFTHAHEKSKTPLDYFFTTMRLTEPSETETLALLKSYQPQIENTYQITIADETFPYALSMTKHYLGGESILDKAFELLESGAARANASEQTNPLPTTKPLVTPTTLSHVITNWTGIPLSHLHHNKFKSSSFIQYMQQRLYGQETAIAGVASLLQQACIQLQEKSQPFCNFLFAGPSNIGKREFVQSMANYLFGSKKALLTINSQQILAATTLDKLKVTIGNDTTDSFLKTVQQMPYALILLENAHDAIPETLALFRDIFTQGIAFDEHGQVYHFEHTMIVITTTIASSQLATLTQQISLTDTTPVVDLLQLVLNETPNHSLTHTPPHLSSQELCDEITPILESHFSEEILRYFHIIPFIPHDTTSLEKMLRLKLSLLTKRLDSLFGIELNYPPEVVRFLMNEARGRKQKHEKPVDKVMEQHVYACVAHEILMHLDEKNRPKHLLLQVSESGQLLVCKFVTLNTSVRA